MKRLFVMRRFITVCCASILAGCGFLGGREADPCRPVDVGGECFTPSRDAFVEHAVTSAGAWPQLDQTPVSAGRVIEGFDLSENSATWLVPLLSESHMVAITRFLPIGEEVKLGEIALLEQPLDPLPEEFPGELVLFLDLGCADDPSIDCLFSEMRWAVRLADGTYQLPDASVVEQLP